MGVQRVPDRRGLRLRAATKGARIAAFASRSLHRGAGSVIGGRVILACAPQALATLTKDRTVVLISGTNGKTSTTALITVAMQSRGPVVANASGANMPAGIAAALADGAPTATAALEVDEQYLPTLLTQTKPRVVVLTNLSRDQLDRAGEVAMIANKWRAALAASPHVTVVANADDPMVVWAAGLAARTIWVGAGQDWRQDSRTCPQCDELLYDHGRAWWCRCGFHRPSAAWQLPSGRVESLQTPYGSVPPLRGLPGRVNEGNALLALACADHCAIPPRRALPRMIALSSVAGRYDTLVVDGHQVRLLLGKNPAGWCALLDVLAPAPAPIVVAVNCRAADGRDASWLWDVPFERLRGRTVIATGDRRQDLAVRLLHADVQHIVARSPWHLAELTRDEPVDVVATYTAFYDIREQVRHAS